MTALALLLLASVASGAAQTPPTDAWERQTWRTENGLPQNSVHAILQGKYETSINEFHQSRAFFPEAAVVVILLIDIVFAIMRRR